MVEVSDYRVQTLVAEVAEGAKTRLATDAARAVIARQPREVILHLAALCLVRQYNVWKSHDVEDMKPEPPRPMRVRGPKRRGERSLLPEDVQADIDARFRASIDHALTIYKREVREEWAMEFLAETFELPDGSRVTWADATVEQHHAGREHAHMAAVDALESVAKHDQAITELQAAAAPTLAHLIAIAA